ncbi:MAG: DUF1499 domain-containing protein, partial [Alphaproteobacteria bacterium]
APTLAAAWRAVVGREPRTEVVAVSPDGLRIEATQRTAICHFVDDISALCLPDGAGGAMIAIYSRSRVGFSDFGVNRRRVTRWLKRLAEELRSLALA